MAVSDRQSSGGRKVGRPSQVVLESPELGVECALLRLDIATLFFVDGADLKNVLRCLFFTATLALCRISESFFPADFQTAVFFVDG